MILLYVISVIVVLIITVPIIYSSISEYIEIRKNKTNSNSKRIIPFVLILISLILVTSCEPTYTKNIPTGSIYVKSIKLSNGDFKYITTIGTLDDDSGYESLKKIFKSTFKKFKNDKK